MAPAQRQPSQHFIDLTTSLYRVGHSPMGVLRSEREIARRLLSDQRLRAIPVAFHDGQMIALEPEQVRVALDSEDAVRLVRSGEIVPPVIAPSSFAQFGRVGQFLNYGKASVRALTRIFVGAVPIYYRKEVQQALLNVRATIKSIFSEQRRLLARDMQRHKVASSLVVHPREGDVLWTCGDYGVCVPLRRIAEQKRLKRFRVAVLGYDMIRVHHPEWNPLGTNRDLSVAQTVDLFDAADLIYCISDSTRRDLADFSSMVYRPDPRLELLALGSDIPKDKKITSDSLEVALPWLAGRKFALAVGSVEVRKNYRVLLEAWINLSANSAFDLDLVIVGRPLQDVAIAEIQASPLFGRRIFWLTSCPDRMLIQLYERCHLVLCPSQMEGWGLSVTEGLAHGKPVICSDRGGIPEAAMNMATVLDPTDSSAWQSVIQAKARAPERPGALAILPKWDATADSVCRGLLALAQARSEH